jgi:glutamate 5-kinase
LSRITPELKADPLPISCYNLIMKSRDFSFTKRMVIKIGTNLLSGDEGIDYSYVKDIASQVARVKKRGIQPLIVTSGAIGMGAGELGITQRVEGIKLRQACAAIGQPLLMHSYRQAFSDAGLKIAQVLITMDVLSNRKSYVNLRNSVETLLALEVIPIFNENDSISTEEIGSAFGDNDRLSALVASKIDSDLLLILTDIDAFYDLNPRKHPEAKPISRIDGVTDQHIRNAGKGGSLHSTGGMQTKLKAVSIAEDAGCHTVIAHGREPGIIEKILSGEELGTWFVSQRRLKNRTRWILNSEPEGFIQIDPGAMKALRNNKSLLPTGIKSVTGVFKAGDVVLVNDAVKLVTSFNSTELRSLIGKHSDEIERILGKGRKDVVARPEDMAFIEK